MPKAKVSTDHLGNEFESEAAMTKHWKMDRNVYSARRSRGMGMEEALTRPVGKPRTRKTQLDRLVEMIETYVAMEQAWDRDRRELCSKISDLVVYLENTMRKPSEQ